VTRCTFHFTRTRKVAGHSSGVSDARESSHEHGCSKYSEAVRAQRSRLCTGSRSATVKSRPVIPLSQACLYPAIVTVVIRPSTVAFEAGLPIVKAAGANGPHHAITLPQHTGHIRYKPAVLALLHLYTPPRTSSLSFVRLSARHSFTNCLQPTCTTSLDLLHLT
jgi:hypothetical protein